MNARAWTIAALAAVGGFIIGLLVAVFTSPLTTSLRSENENLCEQVKLLESELAEINAVLKRSEA